MNESEYAEIYTAINASNIKSLSKRYGVHEKILTMILNQKIVRGVRQRSHEIKKNSQAIKERWIGGDEILFIARELDFPPALISSILLKELGFSDNGKKKAFRDPSLIKEPRLRSEVIKALNEDTIYSPTAHKIQIARGRLGETILSEWLAEKKIEYTAERIEKEPNTKTPDFLLHRVLRINDHQVRWIESKASFGDAELHNYYMEKQYSSYLERLGDGMVVYWYGCLETIKNVKPKLFVVDYTFFPKQYTRLFE